MSSGQYITAVLAGGLLAANLAVQAGNDRYGASLVSSTWTVHSSTRQCDLRHAIPQLGEACFSQTAGRTLTFSLVIPQESQFARQVTWRAVPLPWKHGLDPVEIGRQSLPGNSKTLELSPEESLQLYQQLERGMSVDFVFSDGAQDRTGITVDLSAVRFTGQTRAFQTCVAGLIKLAAEPGKAKAGKVSADIPVPFADNSYELDDRAREILGDLARDYRIGKSHSRILVAGHTDAQESPESAVRLAQRRAREIKGYLVRRGLPAERIEIRQAGTRLKAAGEGTDARSRATLWLVN